MARPSEEKHNELEAFWRAHIQGWSESPLNQGGYLRGAWVLMSDTQEALFTLSTGLATAASFGNFRPIASLHQNRTFVRSAA